MIDKELREYCLDLIQKDLDYSAYICLGNKDDYILDGHFKLSDLEHIVDFLKKYPNE